MRSSDWSSDVCSSDLFEGRAPGTEGEDRTIAYVVGEWAKAGLEPVPDSATPWLQSLPFVETQAPGGTAKFKVNGRDVENGRASCRGSVGSVRVDLGGRRLLKHKKHNEQ